MLLLRSGAKDCCEVGGIRVEQEEDGLVRVERLNRREPFPLIPPVLFLCLHF